MAPYEGELDFLRQAYKDVQQLLGLNNEDARTLIRVKAAEVGRLTSVPQHIFLRYVSRSLRTMPNPSQADGEAAIFLESVARSLGKTPNPSQADAEAAITNLLKKQPDTQPLVDRLREDRKLQDGSYRASERSLGGPKTVTDDADKSHIPPAEPVTQPESLPDEPEPIRERHPAADGPAVPSRARLVAASGAAAVSVIGGGAGAVIGDDPVLDWLWLAWGVLGLLASLLIVVAAISRQRYVSLLVASGLTSVTSEDQARIDAIIHELTRIGATREVTLLLSQRHMPSTTG
jgi:hypothetical protein